MIKVKKIKGKVHRPNAAVTIGAMVKYWEDRGSFNVDLYLKISTIKAN
jgi:hypothetical protein